MTSSDRIEKKILLQVPRSRVWRALTKAEEFGAWFRVKLEGEFAVGKKIQGKITYPGYEHLTMDVTVERMDEEKLFSLRWHPYAIDPKVDYSKEPTTLVEFRLAAGDYTAPGSYPVRRRFLDASRNSLHAWALAAGMPTRRPAASASRSRCGAGRVVTPWSGSATR